MLELRSSARRLLRAPGYVLTVVLLLGLALAANGGMFSVIYGLLYKPLPFPQHDQLVTVGARFLGMDAGLSVPLLEHLAADGGAVTALSAYQQSQVEVYDEAGQRQAQLQAARVQPGLLALLGARPVQGRLFGAEDAQDGAARTVVLSWETWQQRYGGAEDAIGKTIRLDDEDFRIVGVLAQGFGFPDRATRAWLPLAFNAEQRAPEQLGSFGSTFAIARLQPGVSAAAAGAQVTTLARALPGLKQAFGEEGRFSVEVRPLRRLWLGDGSAALQLMLLAVALVLLVTAANLCNLAIARGLARRQELAVQEALGAGRWRQARQALVEALLPCLAAAAVGLAALPAVLALLRRFELVPANTPQTIGIDPLTVAVIGVLTLAVALAMAASSLWFKRGDLHAAIRRSSARQTGSQGAQRARQALIVGQIALTVALLVGVGLLLRSSQRLLAEDIGFDREHLVFASLGMLAPRTADAAQQRARLDALIEGARNLPGVAAVGAGNQVPFGDSMSLSNFVPPGAADDIDPQPSGYQSYADADYFTALGMPLTRGRAFTAEEVRNRAPVAIVDERFVQRYFGERDPVGQHLRIGQRPENGVEQPLRELTIVGVVPTAKQRALDETTDYVAIYQARPAPTDGTLLLRTTIAPELVVEPLRALFKQVAPDGSPGHIVAMNGRIAASMADRTRLNTLLQMLGAVALALASVGLYAVLAYAVRMRQAEFGVRMALGADTARILRTVLSQGLILVGIGLVAGLPLAYAAARLVAGQLHGVGPLDLPTLAGVAAVLGAVGLAACWLPARRAARTDPIVALRQE